MSKPFTYLERFYQPENYYVSGFGQTLAVLLFITRIEAFGLQSLLRVTFTAHLRENRTFTGQYGNFGLVALPLDCSLRVGFPLPLATNRVGPLIPSTPYGIFFSKTLVFFHGPRIQKLTFF